MWDEPEQAECYDGHLSVLQLVSRLVIENSEDRLKKASYGALESGWPLLDSSWQCYYMLGTTTKLSLSKIKLIN